MNVLDYAIRIEEEGLQLYERLGYDTQHPDLKRIFGLLADAERKHATELETLKQQVDPADTDSVMLDRACHLESGFKKLLASNDALHELKKDPDAFWHIVRAEEENIRLLEGMAAAEPHEGARTLFLKIAEDEKRHLDTIESIYEFIESPHTYLEWGEFSNLHPL